MKMIYSIGIQRNMVYHIEGLDDNSDKNKDIFIWMERGICLFLFTFKHVVFIYLYKYIFMYAQQTCIYIYMNIYIYINKFSL